MGTTSLTRSINEYRFQYKKLEFINQRFSSTNKHQEFNLHYAYVNSIANSLRVLERNPRDNIVAVATLTRMLAESTGIFKLLIQAQNSDTHNVKFLKAFKKGTKYPCEYTEIVQSLAVEQEDKKKLKIMYNETSRLTHFSSKSFSFIENPEYYKVAFSWCEFIFELMTESIKITLNELENRLSNEAVKLLHAELKTWISVIDLQRDS